MYNAYIYSNEENYLLSGKGVIQNHGESVIQIGKIENKIKSEKLMVIIK